MSLLNYLRTGYFKSHEQRSRELKVVLQKKEDEEGEFKLETWMIVAGVAGIGGLVIVGALVL